MTSTALPDQIEPATDPGWPRMAEESEPEAPAAVESSMPPEPSTSEPGGPETGSGSRPLAAFTPRRIAAVAVAWLAVTVVGVGLVIYGVGPMLEQRDQGNLLVDYRAEIAHAVGALEGLPGEEEVAEAPTPGDPVGIVEINAIGFRQVVVEGVGPQQTRRGPGHVPGTAGPGQPSNSVVVGRQAGFGGPFSQLDQLERGDEIKVITTQGESLYIVRRIGERGSVRGDEEVYGPSDDDRLTLVTSRSILPWSTGSATEVVAELEGLPFERTRQGGWTGEVDGRGRDSSAVAPVMLATMGYAAAGAAAVLLYRRTRPRSAYLMSAPLLVVSTVLVAEAAARLLPAWF